MNLPGSGILKGMAVTAVNFIGSFFDRAHAKRLITEQYPEERPILVETSRSFPFLVFDGDPEKGIRCTACKICEKECPPQCISIVKAKDANGKPILRPQIFDIDISVCMGCQICVEVCPFESIKMDTKFELSTDDRFGGLLLTKDKLAKPNSYYQQMHPHDAAESDAVIAAEKAKAEAKAKAAAEAKIKADAEAKAKAAATAQAATLNARLDAQLAEAEQRIAAARAAAMGALRQVAGETAAVVVTRLTGVQASQPSVDAAVGAALAARGLA